MRDFALPVRQPFHEQSQIDRLIHEYDLKEELNGPWAVRPLALERDLVPPTLVLEDPGGEFLEGLLGRPMPLELFLRIALSRQ